MSRVRKNQRTALCAPVKNEETGFCLSCVFFILFGLRAGRQDEGIVRRLESIP